MSLFSLLLPLLALAAPVPGREAPEPADGTLQVSRSASETALFAGGNFWTVQRYFDGQQKRGVISTMAGYSGGNVDHPTYERVEKGDTGHRESVQVVFNPSKVSYAKLVEGFLRQIDPYDDQGQFCDNGDRFRTAIFYESEGQREAAGKVLRRLEKKLGQGPFRVALLPARAFFPAESLHQEFYDSNPVSYKLYVFGCGREERLEKVWGR